MAKRKRSRKRRLSYHVRNAAIALIFVLLGLALLWPDIRSAFLRALIPIGRGSSGVLDERVSGDAVFCSGQTVLTAPASGTIRLTVKHGDSVRVGDVIAEIGDKDTLASIEENLASAQARLQRYEEETRDAFQELSGLIQECYQQAVTAFYDVQTAYASGNTADFMEKQRVLEREVDGLSRNRSKLMALEDERSDLVSQVEIMQQVASSSSVKILAPVSGIFCADIATLDPELTEARLAEMDASQLSVLAREIRETPEYRIADGQEVTFGDVIGRIVSGEEVKFCLTVKTEQRPDVRTGSKVLVEIGAGSPVACTVSGVTDGKPPGYSVISGAIGYLSPDRYVRACHASLITRREQGIIVPVKSLVDKNGQTGVLLVQKTYAVFHPVEVRMIKGDRAVVQGISETSEIVLKGMKFLEGRRVR
ncbi:MAG: HlyD family efflux transporter periplasmic adaptor subunit [Bacillota bacterium]|jgi:multidrug efflux pump subunit AcrA (membrane-fusion protein)